MNTPIEESLTLHSHAQALERQKADLPDTGRPFRLPDAAVVSRQISELGCFISEMGDEFLFRATDQPAPEHSVRAASAFADAAEHAGQAASSLGMVAQQLAFFASTAGHRHHPEVRQARKDAAEVIDWAAETAREELQQAVTVLRQTAAIISPPSVDLRQQAALARSATAASDGSGALPSPPSAASVAAPVRSQR
ncbi:hypothetical protein [Kitasatospora sp. NPDC051914]|uniref:hypothetical protein n=1 Tax=Kitasatospora sp. NPDC051914 TaxID=3154945 RepID=UPI0034499655